MSYASFGDQFVLPKETVIHDDYYAFAGDLTIFGTIEGDVSLLGGSVTFNGNAAEDGLFVSPVVTVRGAMGDDLRVLAAESTIDTSVQGDMVAITSILTVAKGAQISGSLLSLSSQLVMGGDVGGDIKVFGSDILIDGFVGGDVKVVGERVVFGERAKIAGDIIWAGKEPILSEGAIVLGEIQKSEALGAFFFPESEGKSWIPFFGVLKALMVLLVLLVFSLTLPNLALPFAEHGASIRVLLRNIFLGFGVSIGLFLFGLFLSVSIIGTIAGVLMLSFGLFLLAFSIAGGALLLGRTFFALIVRKNPQPEPSWKLSLVGVGSMLVLGMVPVVGPLVSLFFTMASFGIMAHSVYRVLKSSNVTSLPISQ